MRASAEGRRQERGAATVLVLVLVGVIGAVAVGGVLAGGALVGHRRAAAAADLAALAGAEALGAGGGSAAGAPVACEAAGQVSERNDARLTGCFVDGLEVVVEVVVDVPTVLGREWTVPGRARAGPSRADYSAGLESGAGGPPPSRASAGPAP